jgi:hypothetical protein
MKYSGSAWACAADVDTDTNTTYTAGTGLDLVGTEFRVESPLTLSGLSAAEAGILNGTNTNTTNYSAGVFGRSSAATGFTYGVSGQADSTQGRGVYGNAPAATGFTYGVVGLSKSTSGTGVYASADAVTGTTYGVFSDSFSTDGYAGYFNNNTTTGVALKAAGSGIIQSTAKSYVWISGNGARKYYDTDTTIINMQNFGGALVQHGGAAGGNKNIILPITVTSPLYGQAVTISGVDIYWKGETSSDLISAVILRRQTGVC